MDEIYKIIREISGNDNLTINEDTDLTLDLGFDSMKIIQLISEMETKFKVEFSEDLIVLPNFNNAKNIQNTIERCKRNEGSIINR